MRDVCERERACVCMHERVYICTRMLATCVLVRQGSTNVEESLLHTDSSLGSYSGFGVLAMRKVPLAEGARSELHTVIEGSRETNVTSQTHALNIVEYTLQSDRR